MSLTKPDGLISRYIFDNIKFIVGSFHPLRNIRFIGVIEYYGSEYDRTIVDIARMSSCCRHNPTGF